MTTLTFTHTNSTPTTSNLRYALTIAEAMLWANLKRPTTYLTTTLTPLFILLIFWILSGNDSPSRSLDEIDITRFMFPAVIGMAVMFAGQILSARITTWRQQGVFQRLAVTPAPLGSLVSGMAIAEVVGAVLQGVLVLLFGVLVLQLPVNWVGVVAMLGVMLLGSMCFAALGGVIASLIANPQAASSAFIFILLPMFFLGGGFPPNILPPALRAISPWLPTQMFNSLLRALIETGNLPEDALWSLGGLLVYGVIFTAITIRWFKTE